MYVFQPGGTRALRFTHGKTWVERDAGTSAQVGTWAHNSVATATSSDRRHAVLRSPMVEPAAGGGPHAVLILSRVQKRLTIPGIP